MAETLTVERVLFYATNGCYRDPVGHSPWTRVYDRGSAEETAYYEEMARVRLRLRTDLETLFQVGHLPESLRVMIYDQAVATHRPSEGGREADRVKELMVIYGKIASIAMLSYSEGMVAMVRKNQETQP